MKIVHVNLEKGNIVSFYNSISDTIRRIINPKLRWIGIVCYDVQATLMWWYNVLRN